MTSAFSDAFSDAYEDILPNLPLAACKDSEIPQTRGSPASQHLAHNSPRHDRSVPPALS